MRRSSRSGLDLLSMSELLPGLILPVIRTWGQAGHYKAWVLPSEMTCHLHILVMSGELATGVDQYTLIACSTFLRQELS